MKKPLTPEEWTILNPEIKFIDPVSPQENLDLNEIPGHASVMTTEEIEDRYGIKVTDRDEPSPSHTLTFKTDPSPKKKLNIFEKGMDRDEESLMVTETTHTAITPSAYDGREIRKLKVYVGVDPGINGGISFIDPDGHFNRWVVPRLESGEANIPKLFDIINGIVAEYEPVFIIEDVHALFGVSAANTFQFGFIVGVLRAVIFSTQKRVEFVQPKKWQALLWANIDKVYKPKKENQKKPTIDTKQTSLMCAIRLFPNFNYSDPNKPKSQKAHDGIYDSLLLAEYGRRMNL